MRFIDLNTDYDLLNTWWTAYKFPIIPKESLPKNGFIIDNVCAGFIYCTDSNIAWLEFIVANPNISKDERKKGLQELILGLVGLSKELGYSVIFSSVKHQGLIERYKEVGFREGDVNMTNLIRGI